jgi:hypothetical protein
MKFAQFVAKCPLELGDWVVLEGAAVQVTDILTVHSLKNGTVEFAFEYNNSGKYAASVPPTAKNECN